MSESKAQVTLSPDYIHCSNYHIKEDTEHVLVNVADVNTTLKQLISEVRELKCQIKQEFLEDSRTFPK